MEKIHFKIIQAFVEYTRELLKKIEKNLNKLLRSYSDIKEYNDTLSTLYRKFSEFEKKYDNGEMTRESAYKKIKEIFNKVNSLDNKVYNNAQIISSEGRKRILKIFLPLLALTTAVYGWCVKDFFFSHWYYIIPAWLCVALVTALVFYFISRFFIFRTIKLV